MCVCVCTGLSEGTCVCVRVCVCVCTGLSEGMCVGVCDMCMSVMIDSVHGC